MSLLVDLDKVSFIAIYSSIHILLFSKSQLCAQQHVEKILKCMKYFVLYRFQYTVLEN